MRRESVRRESVRQESVRRESVRQESVRREFVRRESKSAVQPTNEISIAARFGASAADTNERYFYSGSSWSICRFHQRTRFL